MAQTVHHLLKQVSPPVGTAKFIQRWLTQVVYQPQHKLPEPILNLCLVLVIIQHQQRASTLNITILITDGTWSEAAAAQKLWKAATWTAATTVLIHPVQFSMLRMMVQM